MILTRERFVVLAVLSIASAACEGDGGSSAPPATKAEPLIALVGDVRLEADTAWVGRCFDPVLPLDESGVPDCVVLVSRRSATYTPPVACKTCEGEHTRVPSAETLARAALPQGEGDGCLCELLPDAPDPADPDAFPGEPSHGGWWYTPGAAPERCPIARFNGDLVIARDTLRGPGELTWAVTCYGRLLPGQEVCDEPLALPGDLHPHVEVAVGLADAVAHLRVE